MFKQLAHHVRPAFRCCGAASTSTASHKPFRPDVRWPNWEVVIGIEVHAQLKSRTKLFSNAWTNDPPQPPNTRVSAFDAGFPGTLPCLNTICVDLAVKTALALHSHVQSRSSFDRKHYFYFDLPLGYQITQHYAPISRGGHLFLRTANTRVRVKQIQLEQDTGKSIFDASQSVSSIDLNRAGTGLLEIVSEPDLRSPEEAAEYVRTLQALLRSVGSSDGNMEQGSLRCDVNVSVKRPNSPPGTRCEIKNLNSVKFMMMAITSEVLRQIDLLQSGQSVPQDTRGFDEAKAETYMLRSKEDAPDYRYMPDPNIPPLVLDTAYVERMRNSIPELSDATRLRLQRLDLSDRDVDALMAIDAGREVGMDGKVGRGAISYFDAISRSRDPKIVVNWITQGLLGQLAIRSYTFAENPISVEQMGNLIDLVQSGTITGSAGKTLLRHMLDHPSDDMPMKLAGKLSIMALAEDDASLDKWCYEAIEALPEESEAVRKGNLKVVNKLVGKVMKTSRSTADAVTVRTKLLELLAPTRIY